MRLRSLCLTVSTPALLALLALPTGALAQACDPAAPDDGDTVVCAGTGVGITDGGLDEATITVLAGAVITGADQGFEFDDEVTFVNHGTITGLGDHGVQGDNDVRVTNTGTITGDADGVNIDNNGVLINSGSIYGADDGVQLEENAEVINELGGVIEGADEAVNINTDGARLTNHGTIIGGDDGVNAASGAVIINTGTIRSIGGAQDAVDLDDGTITNSGLILADGVEDGIDFDPGAAASTVTNTGTIEGNIGINTDAADTQSQTVVNSGTITGRGGVALFLGAGDDVLQIEGGRINGMVDLGDGTDTLRVTAMAPGVLSFVSAPEVIETADNVLFDGLTLVAASPAAFAGGDRLAARMNQTLSYAMLAEGMGEGFWVSGSGVIGRDGSAGTLALGRDFGSFGVFAAFGRGAEDGVDGFDLSRDEAVIGVRTGFALAPATKLDVAAFAGWGSAESEAAAEAGGTGKTDTSTLGLTARLSHQRAAEAGRPGLAFSAQAGVARVSYDGFTPSALGGASFGDRDVTTSFLALELGVPMLMQGMVVTPFVGATGIYSDGDDVTMRLGGSQTSFAVDGGSTGLFTLGVDLAAQGPAPWTARVAAGWSDEGGTEVNLGVRMRF